MDVNDYVQDSESEDRAPKRRKYGGRQAPENAVFFTESFMSSKSRKRVCILCSSSMKDEDSIRKNHLLYKCDKLNQFKAGDEDPEGLFAGAWEYRRKNLGQLQLPAASATPLISVEAFDELRYKFARTQRRFHCLCCVVMCVCG